MNDEKRKYLLLNEVKSKKEKLKNDIEKLIIDFEDETKTTVDDISISRIRTTSKNGVGNWLLSQVTFDVKI